MGSGFVAYHFSKRSERHPEAPHFEARLIRVRLLDRDQARTNCADVEVGGANQPVVADSLGHLAPEPTFLVRRHQPAVSNGEYETGRFAAAKEADQIGEQLDIAGLRHRDQPQLSALYGLVELRSLGGNRDFFADVIRNHELKIRQPPTKIQPRRVDQIDEDIGICDDDSMRRNCHSTSAPRSPRPASSIKLPIRFRSNPSIAASSSSLPREISSRRYASSANPRMRCWKPSRTSAGSGSGRPRWSAICLPLPASSSAFNRSKSPLEIKRRLRRR